MSERAPERASDAQAAHQPPTQLRIAVVVMALQILALLATAGVLLVKTATGDANSVGRALTQAFAALGLAAILALCARGMLAFRPAARTPVVVIELLALPVAYSLAFQAGRLAYGGPILVAAVLVLYLLFTPPVREVLDRHRD